MHRFNTIAHDAPGASFLTRHPDGGPTAVVTWGSTKDEAIARALDAIASHPHNWRTPLAVTPAIYPAMWWIIAFDT